MDDSIVRPKPPRGGIVLGALKRSAGAFQSIEGVRLSLEWDLDVGLGMPEEFQAQFLEKHRVLMVVKDIMDGELIQLSLSHIPDTGMGNAAPVAPDLTELRVETGPDEGRTLAELSPGKLTKLHAEITTQMECSDVERERDGCQSYLDGIAAVRKQRGA